MASMKEMAAKQKEERMEALNHAIDTEIATMIARLEICAIQLNIPIQEAHDLIPWLLQCHLAELSFENDDTLEDFVDDAKRAFTVVSEEAEEGDEEEDEEDGKEGLMAALEEMGDKDESTGDKKEEPS